jgi:protein-L-isoaspartate(D-aspartate) O-methyltransferase
MEAYMEPELIRDSLRRRYADVAKRPEGQFTYPVGRESAERLNYRRDLLDSIPSDVVKHFVGVGNPYSVGKPRPGWNVLGVNRLTEVIPRALVLGLAGLATLLTACALGDDRGDDEAVHRARRLRMVETQIAARGITDPVVLAAMRAVPRHRFVPEGMQPLAYDDTALPIGEGQTISQPYVVAVMTAAIRPRKGMRVLEIGTGSGYQAAVLAACVAEVDSIEVVPALGRRAGSLLKALGYRNVHVRIGDGFDGWPERGPFDAVVLTAAPERVPQPLLDQLRLGGRLVAPVGRDLQDLIVMTRTERGFVTEVIDAVRFVPMTGKAAAEKGGSPPSR